MRKTASVLILLAAAGGCKSAERHRRDADRAAAAIIADKQREALGREEPFTIESPADTLRRRLLLGQQLPYSGPDALGTDGLEPIEHWPEPDYPARDQAPAPPWSGPDPLVLTLTDALQIGARNSREYQDAKESVFLSALDLDLERDRYRNTFFGTVDGLIRGDLTSPDAPDGVEGGFSADLTRRLKSGAVLAGMIGLDLVRLLTGGKDSAFGIFGDASITLPLLRGAGRHVVTEPLTQAERDVVYALRTFDRFRRTFAVQVASEYLDVLRQLDQVNNAEENYRGLIVLTRRTGAWARAGRLPGVQVDQSQQDELRARDRWIAALQTYQRRLDQFKQTLGLPTDARIELSRDELQASARAVQAVLELGSEAGPDGPDEAGGLGVPSADSKIVLREPDAAEGGPLEMDEERAIRLALGHRQDLRNARGRVFDAQRGVAVAADALRAGLTLTGRAEVGESRSISSATLGDGRLRPTKGVYSADLLLDLPWERTAERNAYRESYITLESAVRDLQELEDRIKRDVRDALRSLLQARESVRIQDQAVRLARGRVESTNLLLEAGRAQVRDVLESQEALISAQNALTDALVRYRVAELEMQRDLGLLGVDSEGIWKEYRPDDADD